jgi:hypothetical protein
MKIASKGNPNQPSRWRGRSKQILLMSGGCEARKIPAIGNVFSLTSSFIEHSVCAKSKFPIAPLLADHEPVAHLPNLSRRYVRYVRPTLEKRNIAWYVWYAMRRGIGTLATSEESALAAKGLLRHTNVATTEQFCIKDEGHRAGRPKDRRTA